MSKVLFMGQYIVYADKNGRRTEKPSFCPRIQIFSIMFQSTLMTVTKTIYYGTLSVSNFQKQAFRFRVNFLYYELNTETD